MAHLFEIALSNLIVAALIALPAAFAGLWGRRPALTHALWLLVLLKLITPPFLSVPIDWSAPLPVEQEPMAVKIEAAPPIEWIALEAPLPPLANEVSPLPDVAAVEPMADPPPVVVPVALAEPEPIVAATPWPWLEIVAMAWLIGSTLWLALALIRMIRFGRMLTHGQAASVELRTLAERLAADIGIRCPQVCVVPGKISPMLWALWGTPRLVLPAELIARLPTDQLATMLVHELAHWRRRDDRTRWLEIVVLGLYWWCPLVWWARRELHQAEEECCDAWVVSQLPESAKAYALALVETVDFLADAPTTLPTAASGLGHVRLLKRRLTMILNGKTPRALTLTGLLGVAGVGLLLLPLAPGWAQTQRRQGGDDQQQEREEGERKEGRAKGSVDGPKAGDLQKIRAEIQRLHAEMQQRTAQMHLLMDHLRRMEQAKQGGAPNAFRSIGDEGKKKFENKKKVDQNEQNQQGEQGGEDKKRPDGKKKGGQNEQNQQGGGGRGGQGGGGGGPGAGGFGGAFGGGGFGGFGGGFAGPGGMPGGGQRSPVDQRLNDVERKLDQMLQEIRAMRNDMKGRQGGAGGNTPMRNPNPMPTPRGRASGPAPAPPATPAPRRERDQNEN